MTFLSRSGCFSFCCRTVRGLLYQNTVFSTPANFWIPSRSFRFTVAMAKYNVMFVLGGPGAGKGTQCENIVREFGYVHLSAGDLLREERQRPGSEFGEEIEGHIQNGTIVPVQITCSLLHRAMEQSGKQNFLIDGFPRNKDNLDGWNEAMSEVADVKSVLFFNCAEKVCVERCMNRGKTSGRSDDNMDSLRKRIQTYTNSTMPIIEHYKLKNLVQELNGEETAEQAIPFFRNGILFKFENN